MPEALAALKRELGDDAVILGTRVLPTGGIRGLLGSERVEITAAIHAPSPSGKAAGPRPSSAPQSTPIAVARRDGSITQRTSLRSDQTPEAAGGSGPAVVAVPRIESPAPGPQQFAKKADPGSVRCEAPTSIDACWMPHYLQLVRGEVADQLARTFIHEAASALDGDASDPVRVRAALADCIARRIPPCGGIQLTEGRLRRVALVGPAGAGKTTTLAKLAAHYALRRGKRVAILSLDMNRPATHDQMRRCAETIGVPVHVAENVAAVKDVLRSQTALDLLLIDTHGVGPREQASFVRLAAMVRAARPDETHLVLPASLSPASRDRAARVFAPLNISSVVLSRIDEVIGLGAVLEALERLGWGVSYLTDGQRVPTDLREASLDRLTELLLAPLP